MEGLHAMQGRYKPLLHLFPYQPVAKNTAYLNKISQMALIIFITSHIMNEPQPKGETNSLAKYHPYFSVTEY